MHPERYKQNPDYLPPKKDEPPLHCAARLGDQESLRRLVGEGRDVNQAFDMRLDLGGRNFWATPLMVAAGSGYGASIETMRLLLELGSKPLLRFENGSIARCAAGGLGWNYLPGGDAARLGFCLELGCDPDETDERAVTLLAEAANSGDVERVKVLLNAGAKPNPAPNASKLPAFKFDLKLPKLPFDENAPMPFQIPLHLAVEADNLEMVELLMNAGVDIRMTDNMGRTALFNAQSSEIARRLIKAGLNVEDSDRLGWNPLINAVGDGSLRKIETFLALGADVNHVHDHGYSVFMHGVGSSERSMEIIKALLSAGANPKLVSELGWNAFHACLINDDIREKNEELTKAIFELLLNLGVDINQKDKQGISPLAMAQSKGLETEEKLLIKLGAKP